MAATLKPIRRVVTGNDAQGRSRVLLDDGENVMKPGDVVVQIGNWHGWCNPREGSLMAFVMMGAKFEDLRDQAPPISATI